MNITPKQYAKAWHELLKDKNVKDANKKMLAHLYKNGKMGWVSEILRNIEELERKEKAIEHATITAAREIPDNEAAKIAKEIIKTDSLSVSKKINPELIAGVRIETKNKRWDLSLKRQLESLSKKLQAQ